MVAASSYQKDGRAAPPRLIAAARIPTISESSAGDGGAGTPPRRCPASRVSATLTEPPGGSRTR